MKHPHTHSKKKIKRKKKKKKKKYRKKNKKKVGGDCRSVILACLGEIADDKFNARACYCPPHLSPNQLLSTPNRASPLVNSLFMYSILSFVQFEVLIQPTSITLFFSMLGHNWKKKKNNCSIKYKFYFNLVKNNLLIKYNQYIWSPN